MITVVGQCHRIGIGIVFIIVVIAIIIATAAAAAAIGGFTSGTAVRPVHAVEQFAELLIGEIVGNTV